ncbi:hypothetical protein CP979_27225 [Streptomyces filamentosus]|nr:hypothetical protein CP979_27225 [Streptomyces filamentosus]
MQGGVGAVALSGVEAVVRGGDDALAAGVGACARAFSRVSIGVLAAAASPEELRALQAARRWAVPSNQTPLVSTVLQLSR